MYQGDFKDINEIKDLNHLSRVFIPSDDWRKGICTCKHFPKKYTCKHLLSIAFIKKMFEPRIEAKKVFLGQKSKRGPSKKARYALLKD